MAQGIFEKAAPLYASGQSLREIAKELGIPKTNIRNTLVASGVDLRPTNCRRHLAPVRTTRLRVGAAPYGYCIIHGRLVEVPKEQQTIQLVMRLRSQNKSLTSIAAYLNQHKIKPRSGKQWDHSIVRSIVQRNQTKKQGGTLC